jgi:putative transposase
MLIRKAYKFQLKLPKAQKITLEKVLASFAGCKRFVWNKALGIQKQRLDNKEKIYTYKELANMLVIWKKDTDTSFLKSCHSQILQQTLKQLDLAFKNCFNKKAIQEFPIFKKKGIHDSFLYPQGFKLDTVNNRVFLPKIGYIPYVLGKNKQIEGNAKNITVSKSNNKWYIAIQVEQEISDNKLLHKLDLASAVGLDVGVTNIINTSNQEQIKQLDTIKLEQNLKKAQRRLAKKVKYSKRFNKAKGKIQKLHSRIANKRKNHLHKITSNLSKNHALIIVEDLKISNMTKSAKGTIENKGKNVKAKSGLNKSILHQGWGEMIRQIEYKQSWNGGDIIKVNPKYTSQKCNACGNINKLNRKSQSYFKCILCNHTDDADINAAKNILAAGLAVLARGEYVRPNVNICENHINGQEAISVKREPTKDTNQNLVSVGNLAL